MLVVTASALAVRRSGAVRHANGNAFDSEIDGRDCTLVFCSHNHIYMFVCWGKLRSSQAIIEVVSETVISYLIVNVVI